MLLRRMAHVKLLRTHFGYGYVGNRITAYEARLAERFNHDVDALVNEIVILLDGGKNSDTNITGEILLYGLSCQTKGLILAEEHERHEMNCSDECAPLKA